MPSDFTKTFLEFFPDVEYESTDSGLLSINIQAEYGQEVEGDISHLVKAATVRLENGEIVVRRDFTYSGMQTSILTDPETKLPKIGRITLHSSGFEDVIEYRFNDGLVSINETFSISDGSPTAKRDWPYSVSKLGEAYNLIFARDEYTPSELRNALFQLEALLKPGVVVQ
jgi:hypothetical protein